MSDQQLLELAAKAAGIQIDFTETNGGGRFNTGFDAVGNAVLDWVNYRTWNPLTDDGDALRLAANLRLEIVAGKHPGDGCTVESQRTGIAGCTAFRDDKAEQMRRAIVRVAASIGEAMP